MNNPNVTKIEEYNVELKRDALPDGDWVLSIQPQRVCERCGNKGPGLLTLGEQWTECHPAEAREFTLCRRCWLDLHDERDERIRQRDILARAIGVLRTIHPSIKSDAQALAAAVDIETERALHEAGMEVSDGCS